MKWVLAQMKHETNTFSPVPTPLARFGHGRERPWEGREAYEEFKGTGTALGDCRDIATNRALRHRRLPGGRHRPAAKRYLMLKSRVHWRAGLGAIVRAVVECAGSGVCTSDYSQLQFRHLRRPVYPLDPM